MNNLNLIKRENKTSHWAKKERRAGRVPGVLYGKGVSNLLFEIGELFLPLLDLVDREKELERLNKEKTKLEGEILRVEKKLSNERFVSKAPEAVVNEERAKGVKYKEMLEAVLERIEALQ